MFYSVMTRCQLHVCDCALYYIQDGKLTQVARPNPPNFGPGFGSKFVPSFSFGASHITLNAVKIANKTLGFFFFFQIMLSGLNMKNGSKRLSSYFKCSRSFWKKRSELTESQRKLCLPNKEQLRRPGESSLRKMLSSSSMLQSSRV